jgi:hypothetical protein
MFISLIIKIDKKLKEKNKINFLKMVETIMQYLNDTIVV